MKLKKLMAVILAMILALSCASASAGSFSVDFSADQEVAKRALTELGVPEKLFSMIDPVLGMASSSLGIKVITVEDGAQIDLTLDGKQTVSLGLAENEQGFTLVSTLFPNYAITLKKETISKLMEIFSVFKPSVSVSAQGAGILGGMDLSPVQKLIDTYITPCISACMAAAAPGEAVKGEYQYDGCNFDTMVPITVDVPAIAKAVTTMTDGLLSDKTVADFLKPMSWISRGKLGVEQIKAGVQEFIAHFPANVTVEYYNNSDGSSSFWMNGQASDEGKEDPSYVYNILIKDAKSGTITFNGYEQEMIVGLTYSEGGFREEFSLGGKSMALDVSMEQGDPTALRASLYLLDPDHPMLTLAVTVSENGARTLPVEIGKKTALPVEDVLNGKNDGMIGLFTNIMMNNLGSLMSLMGKLTEAMPDLGGLLGFFMPRTSGTETEASETEKETVPDLTGDWSLVYSIGGIKISENTIFLYEDGTYEVLGDDQKASGFWTFDGETLVLLLDGEALSLKWDEETHQLTGGVNDIKVTMFIPIEPESEEAPAEETGDALSAGMRLMGGWSVADDTLVTPEIEQLLWSALDSVQTGTITVSYTPVAYLGSQVVAGTNHAILCKASEINQGSSWVIIYLYEDLNGNVTVLSVTDLALGI